MRCPFLREAQVKFCQASAFRKMIVRTSAHADNERCSSPDYVNCPAAKQHHEELPSQSHCPFLQESLAQYCAAAAVSKFVPYSESLLSRCGNESHRYCELFLAIAQPQIDRSLSSAKKGNANEGIVEGIAMPRWMAYSANHMWLDADDDGLYHVGIDAFLAGAIGRVERISFVATHGVSRPATVLTVKGIDVQVVFPNRMLLTRANAYLRANPERLTSDPYTAGWLFEGRDPGESSSEKSPNVSEGLIRDEKAQRWMEQEVHRLSTFIHEQYSRQAGLMMDGGSFSHGVALQLNRDEILHLFNEFFSPYANWRSYR